MGFAGSTQKSPFDLGLAERAKRIGQSEYALELGQVRAASHWKQRPITDHLQRFREGLIAEKIR
jgi:hypothetical protein